MDEGEECPPPRARQSSAGSPLATAARAGARAGYEPADAAIGEEDREGAAGRGGGGSALHAAKRGAQRPRAAACTGRCKLQWCCCRLVFGGARGGACGGARCRRLRLGAFAGRGMAL